MKPSSPCALRFCIGSTPSLFYIISWLRRQRSEVRGDRDDTHLAKYPRRDVERRQDFRLVLRETSAIGGQLRLNVYPADGTPLIGRQPLVNTSLVEEMHAG